VLNALGGDKKACGDGLNPLSFNTEERVTGTFPHQLEERMDSLWVIFWYPAPAISPRRRKKKDQLWK